MNTPWIIAYGVLSLSVFFLGLLVVGLLRQISSVLEQTEAHLASLRSTPRSGLQPGARVPAFRALTRDGSEVDGSTFVGEPWIALFLSSGCGPCDTLIDELRTATLDDKVPLRLIVNGVEGRDLVGGLPAQVLHQRDGEVSRAFETFSTPHAFAIDEAGTVVANAIANTVAILEDLTRSATGGGERTAKSWLTPDTTHAEGVLRGTEDQP